MWYLIPAAFLILGIAAGAWVNFVFWITLLIWCVVAWIKSS